MRQPLPGRPINTTPPWQPSRGRECKGAWPGGCPPLPGLSPTWQALFQGAIKEVSGGGGRDGGQRAARVSPAEKGQGAPGAQVSPLPRPQAAAVQVHLLLLCTGRATLRPRRLFLPPTGLGEALPQGAQAASAPPTHPRAFSASPQSARKAWLSRAAHAGSAVRPRRDGNRESPGSGCLLPCGSPKGLSQCRAFWGGPCRRAPRFLPWVRPLQHQRRSSPQVPLEGRCWSFTAPCQKTRAGSRRDRQAGLCLDRLTGSSALPSSPGRPAFAFRLFQLAKGKVGIAVEE